MSLEHVIELPVLFTDRAVVALQNFESEEGTILRIGVKGGGCSGFEYDVAFDTPRETDGRYEHNGVPYVIDPVSERYVHGTVLDYDSFKGFTFANPNATGSCGCGHSFNVD